MATSAPVADPIDPQVINVKFRDDTNVDVVAHRAQFASASAEARLERLIGEGKATVSPLFGAAPAVLDGRRRTLEEKSNKELPDLTTWIHVRLAADVDPKETISGLLADPLVEHAYTPTRGKLSALTPAQQTKLNDRASKYLGTGETGLGVFGVANVPGALGDNIDVVSIEYDANINHEDLVRSPSTIDAWWPNRYVWSTPAEADFMISHGTSTIGVIAAKRDGIGADGIAPNARVHFSSATEGPYLPEVPGGPPEGSGDPNIFYDAYSRLAPGSVVTTNYGSPVEQDPAVADVITFGTAAGVITIEAAGNEDENFDGPGWANTSLAAGGPDTGAIIVGASGPQGCPYGPTNASKPRHRLEDSSYGERVDVQGPGACVSAPMSWSHWSYGGPDNFGSNANDGYTANYTGTSSASSAIAGVVAALSGAYQERVGKPLTPALARATLKNPALSQPQNNTYEPGNIGPLPNLTAAINAIAVPDAQAPSQPGTISAVSNVGTSINLSWGAAADEIGVISYEVRRNGTPIEVTSTTSFSDRRTVPGESYTYSVYAIDRAGNRSAARTLQLTAAAASAPTDAERPTAPTTVVAGLNTTDPTGTVLVAWSGATDNVGISRYEVRRNGVRIALVGASPTPYADTTVQPGTYYRYEVVAVDAAGNRSAATPPASITTGGPRGDVIAPTLAAAPTAAAFSRTVLVTWSAATDAVGGLTYEVRRATSAGGPYTVLDHTANANYIDAKVAPSTAYFYRVTAIDGAGNRSVALTTNVTTAAFSASTDTTPPSTPVTSGVTIDGANQPVVNWATATDDVGIARYQVRRNGLYLATATAPGAADASTKKGRYAVYSVLAQDAAGNTSALSAPVGGAPAP